MLDASIEHICKLRVIFPKQFAAMALPSKGMLSIFNGISEAN